MPRGKPVKSPLGKAVRGARLAVGLTQAQFAEAAEIAVETVSRIERGTLTPSVPVILRISDVLRVSVDALLRGTPMPARPKQRPEVMKVLALVRDLDEAEVTAVIRGLQAFLSLRTRPASPRRKPTGR